jgi:hypothetical protein
MEGIPVLQVCPHPPAPSPKKGRIQSPSPALGEGFRVRATKVGCTRPDEVPAIPANKGLKPLVYTSLPVRATLTARRWWDRTEELADSIENPIKRAKYILRCHG